MGFPGGSNGKESACNAGDPGLIPGSERSSGEGNGNTLQDSRLENPMDRGTWQATGHGLDTTQRLSHQTIITVTANIYITVSGFQTEPPLDVALLHEGYLELKAIEILQVQEKLLPSCSFLEEFILGIFPREELLAEIDFI